MSGAEGTTGRVLETDRVRDLTSWDSDWAGLRVVVAGIGASGFSAADTLIELGAAVVVVDAGATAGNEAKADTLRIVGAREVLLGAEYAEALPLVDGEQAELVVTSPGWRPTQPLLAGAAAAGRHLSRAVSPRPRPAHYRRAAPPHGGHPRPATGGDGGIEPLLWQRRHLQRHQP